MRWATGSFPSYFYPIPTWSACGAAGTSCRALTVSFGFPLSALHIPVYFEEDHRSKTTIYIYIYIYIYNIFACPTFWHYMYYIYDLINYESESDMIWERRIKSTRRSSCMTALAGQQPLPVCHTSRLVVTVSPPWWRRRRPSSFQQLCSSPRSPLVG